MGIDYLGAAARRAASGATVTFYPGGAGWPHFSYVVADYPRATGTPARRGGTLQLLGLPSGSSKASSTVPALTLGDLSSIFESLVQADPQNAK